MLNVVVLVSGGGTNLQAIIDAILAAKILAASDEELLNKLKAYTAEQKEAVKAKAAKLDSIGYEAYLASK